jgi:hypothetical protein
MGWGRAAVVGALAVVFWAAPARASTVHTDATVGPQASAFVTYYAARGERNDIRVRFRSSGTTIVDRGVRRIRLFHDLGAQDCVSRGPRKVVCNSDDSIFFYLRDRGDRIRFFPGRNSPDVPHTHPLSLAEDYAAEDDDEGEIDISTAVVGGRGGDTIIGTAGPDYIEPGPGSDIVSGRGGNDEIRMSPDGLPDSVRAGGGLDDLRYDARRPLRIDLRAGVAGPAVGEDSVGGLERVHGGSGADMLLGTGDGEAIYGEGGSDTIDGRGGNDLLTGDAPDSKSARANRIRGGAGDDFVDSRGDGIAPTSEIDCGEGEDLVVGDVDDRLGADCESVDFRIRYAGRGLIYEDLERQPINASPVSVAADGTPAFAIRCRAGVRCRGAVALSTPPAGGSAAPAGDYGSGSFDLAPAETRSVGVELTPAGRAAIAEGSPVAVHVTAKLGDEDNPSVDFGWQIVIPR